MLYPYVSPNSIPTKEFSAIANPTEAGTDVQLKETKNASGIHYLLIAAAIIGGIWFISTKVDDV